MMEVREPQLHPQSNRPVVAMAEDSVASAVLNASANLTMQRTIVEAFVKLVVCRKVTVQHVATVTGQILDSHTTQEEDMPVILDVHRHEVGDVFSAFGSNGRSPTTSDPHRDSSPVSSQCSQSRRQADQRNCREFCADRDSCPPNTRSCGSPGKTQKNILPSGHKEGTSRGTRVTSLSERRRESGDVANSADSYHKLSGCRIQSTEEIVRETCPDPPMERILQQQPACKRRSTFDDDDVAVTGKKEKCGDAMSVDNRTGGSSDLPQILVCEATAISSSDTYCVPQCAVSDTSQAVGCDGSSGNNVGTTVSKDKSSQVLPAANVVSGSVNPRAVDVQADNRHEVMDESSQWDLTLSEETLTPLAGKKSLNTHAAEAESESTSLTLSTTQRLLVSLESSEPVINERSDIADCQDSTDKGSVCVCDIDGGGEKGDRAESQSGQDVCDDTHAEEDSPLVSNIHSEDVSRRHSYSQFPLCDTTHKGDDHEESILDLEQDEADPPFTTEQDRREHHARLSQTPVSSDNTELNVKQEKGNSPAVPDTHCLKSCDIVSEDDAEQDMLVIDISSSVSVPANQTVDPDALDSSLLQEQKAVDMPDPFLHLLTSFPPMDRSHNKASHLPTRDSLSGPSTSTRDGDRDAPAPVTVKEEPDEDCMITAAFISPGKKMTCPESRSAVHSLTSQSIVSQTVTNQSIVSHTVANQRAAFINQRGAVLASSGVGMRRGDLLGSAPRLNQGQDRYGRMRAASLQHFQRSVLGREMEGGPGAADVYQSMAAHNPHPHPHPHPHPLSLTLTPTSRTPPSKPYVPNFLASTSQPLDQTGAVSLQPAEGPSPMDYSQHTYQCALCCKIFLHKHKFDRHAMMCGGHRPFKCKICSKGFNQRAHLDTHMKFHIGIKRYRCDVCRKAYVMKGDLIRHLKTRAHRMTLQSQGLHVQ